MNFKKKAMTEIISFTFILLVVIVAALTAYIYSKQIIESTAREYEKENIISFFKKFSQKESQIKRFDNFAVSMDLNFREGLVYFRGNQIVYISRLDYAGPTTCLNDICYSSQDGGEVIYYNLSGDYEFYHNFSLQSGNYQFTITNLKNDEKFRISFK